MSHGEKNCWLLSWIVTTSKNWYLFETWRIMACTGGRLLGSYKQLMVHHLKKAEQHWCYFWKAKLLPKLKNHGALWTAQATTTKQIGVTTEKLLRWNGTVYDASEEIDRQNSWHSDCEGIKESNKIGSFWGNMGETNMSAAEGKLCCYRVLYLLQLSIIS